MGNLTRYYKTFTGSGYFNPGQIPANKWSGGVTIYTKLTAPTIFIPVAIKFADNYSRSCPCSVLEVEKQSTGWYIYVNILNNYDSAITLTEAIVTYWSN